MCRPDSLERQRDKLLRQERTMRKFKRAGKLGQENDHSMRVQFSPPSAIFLPSIFPPDHNRPMTPRALNGVPPPMSAISRIAGELRAFSMNDRRHRAGGAESTIGKTPDRRLRCTAWFPVVCVRNTPTKSPNWASPSLCDRSKQIDQTMRLILYRVLPRIRSICRAPIQSPPEQSQEHRSSHRS